MIFPWGTVESNGPVYIYWVDSNNHLQGCNSLFSNLLSLEDSNKIKGKQFESFQILNIVSANWNKNNLQALNSTNATYFIEKYPTRQNKTIYLCSLKYPLTYEDGTKGIINFSINHQEHQVISSPQYLEEKNETQTTLDALLDALPGHVYWQDIDGTILGCNKRQANSLGFSKKEELIGKKLEELVPPKEVKALLKTIQHVVTTKESVELEEQVTFNNTVRDLYTQKVPLITQEGTLTGILGISLDVTDKKNAERDLLVAKKQAEVANEAKSDFIANVSHDIRTPLSAILGVAEMKPLEQKTIEELREDQKDIVQSAQVLYDLLNQVIDYVRSETGELPVNETSFSLQDLCDRLLKMLKVSFKAKGLTLKYDYDDRIPAYLVGDTMRLHRILLNILGNSIKFTNEGSVKLEIHLQKHERRDCVIKFVIQDTGIGMPEEKLHSIFGRFNRLHPAYEGVYPGAGLGLSIVKQFIDDLDGEIYVQSHVGVGSCFSIFLPFKESYSDEANISDESATETSLPFYDQLHCEQQAARLKTDHTSVSTSGSEVIGPDPDGALPYNVLLVEDGVIVSKQITNMLEQLGCHVDTAFDGKEALQKTKNNAYDFIFMDIGLPDQDGISVTKAIRARKYNPNANIPIVAQTAHVSSDRRNEILDAGLNDVLQKPLSITKIVSALHYFLKEKADETHETIEANHNTNDNTEKATHSDLKVIDCERIAKNMGQTLEQATAFVKENLHMLYPDFDSVKTAYLAKDIDQTRAMCHRLDGALCFICAPRLHAALKAFHASVKEEGFSQDTSTLYQQYSKEIQPFLDAAQNL